MTAATNPFDPFDPGIRIVGNSVTFAGCTCANFIFANGPRGIDVEICVRSRRGGGKLVTARSPSRSYRRAQQGKTEWGFGDITVRTGTRTIASHGALVTLTGSVNP